MAKGGYRNLSIKRSIELDAVECIEAQNALYAEAARLMEEARLLPSRLNRRRLLEGHADFLRRIAGKFDE